MSNVLPSANIVVNHNTIKTLVLYKKSNIKMLEQIGTV